MEDDKQRRAERDAPAADESKGDAVTKAASAEAGAQAGPAKQAAKDAPKDASKDAPKDAAAGGSKDGHEGAAKGAPTGAPTGGSKDVTAGSTKSGARTKKSVGRRGRSQKSTRAAQDRPIDHVRVADGALRSIIGLAAHEVPGVVGMAPVNIGEGLRRILGARQVDEGVSVEHPHGESRADVDIHVVVAYGVNIPVVAVGVRERVRYAARQFAGVTLDEVRVHVEGVSRG